MDSTEDGKGRKKNDRVKVDFDALYTTQTQFFLLLNLFIDGNENFFHFYDELYHLQSSWELQRIPFYPKNPQLWIERSEGWRESSFKFQYKYSLIISWQKIMSLRVWMMKMKSVIENIINVHKLTIKFTDEMMSNRCNISRTSHRFGAWWQHYSIRVERMDLWNKYFPTQLQY